MVATINQVTFSEVTFCQRQTREKLKCTVTQTALSQCPTLSLETASELWNHAVRNYIMFCAFIKTCSRFSDGYYGSRDEILGLRCELFDAMQAQIAERRQTRVETS